MEQVAEAHNPGIPPGLQCFSGRVRVLPPVGVGAILGILTPQFGAPIPLRQVVGPAGGPVPLTAVDGRIATVCGVLVVEDSRVFLDVRLVIPGPPLPKPDLTLLLLLALVLLFLLFGCHR